MSLIKTVPAEVPSVLHGSKPPAPSPLATKKTVVPTTSIEPVAYWANAGLPPLEISRTKMVPADVPLLRHNSRPLTPSSAVKNNVPLPFVNKVGRELEIPAL